MDASTFDPNGVGVKGTLFGLPEDASNASVVVLSVPWEVTVSYGAGTAMGPAAILEASSQLDLADPELTAPWQAGYVLKELDPSLLATSNRLREQTATYIEALETGHAPDPGNPAVVEANETAERWTAQLRTEVLTQLSAGRRVGLLGGDHSCPLGLVQALAEQEGTFGILQIDAHADLRPAYEGFEYSHASIMWNVLKLPAVTKLVQVGIRDLCQQELDDIRSQPERIRTFFDAQLKDAQHRGEPWSETMRQIVEALPEKVYISFDIDGLDPKLCPNTGTPVPGGLEFDQALALIREVVRSGRQLIGFDLVEVSPGTSEWDANVGARLLYKLCCWSAVSQGKITPVETLDL